MAGPAAAPERGHEGAGQGIWSGTISFSLVAIPVRLVKAVEPGRVSFRLLHGKDYSPLLRRMFCPAEERIVPEEEIIRGFEIAPGTYVTLTDEELESVSPERSRTIEIIEFIDWNEVDPLFYDHPYRLLPSKGGEKAYRLLVEVMRRTNRAGLAKFVLADREHLVAILSEGDSLGLITLHYGAEILPAEGLAPKEGEGQVGEKRLARGEIKKLLSEFNPGRYADLRRKRIQEALRRKAKEKAPVEAPAVEEREEEGPPDLVAALKAAMRKTKKSR